MYYLQHRDTGKFFVGYDIPNSDVRFYHSPMIAKRMTKDKALELKNSLPERYESIYKHKLEIVPVENRHVSGAIFSYFLFDDKLRIVRKGDRTAEADWEEFYESDSSYDMKWAWLTEKDRANGRCVMIDPEAIGALTEAPIIGFDVIIEDTVFGEKAKLTADSRVYWFEAYQVKDELELLEENRYVDFQRALIEEKTTGK